MDDTEGLLHALNEFENMADADKILTPELDSIIAHIAKTGRLIFPWHVLKPVFHFKLDKVMKDFFEGCPSRNSTSSEPTQTAEFEVMRQRLLDCLDSFSSAPFTIQRLCEMMSEPQRHYKCSEKFMRGIEKNVLVVSTLDLDDEIDQTNPDLTNNVDSAHTVPVFSGLPNGPVTNGITSTAASTAEEPVSDENSLNDRLSTHEQASTSADSQDQVQCQSIAGSNTMPCSSSTEAEEITEERKEETTCEERNDKDPGQPEEKSTTSNIAEPDSTLPLGKDVEEEKRDRETEEGGAESSKTDLEPDSSVTEEKEEQGDEPMDEN